MAIYSIWESYFSPGSTDEGRRVTQAIWQDMQRFEGYLEHELVEDIDDPGHLLVISRWTTRERADAVLHEYATHPNALRANRLVTTSRRRIVAQVLQSLDP